MKKSVFCILGLIGALSVSLPDVAAAGSINQSDLTCIDQMGFEQMIAEIQMITAQSPKASEEETLAIMNKRHLGARSVQRGVVDIWNVLTESEQKLCIRYPFDALKVNTARKIATTQTEAKFGSNGLGNRSDAFRHGIWNAEMTVMIGKEKAELFATAHEDKDVSGYESDGFAKTAHRDMDLHNNAVGRNIGEQNKKASEEEMANIIYSAVNSPSTQFIWLHE